MIVVGIVATSGNAAPPTTFQQVSLKPPFSEGDTVPQVLVGMAIGRAVVAIPSALVATATVSVHDAISYVPEAGFVIKTQFGAASAPKHAPAYSLSASRVVIVISTPIAQPLKAE